MYKCSQHNLSRLLLLGFLFGNLLHPAPRSYATPPNHLPIADNNAQPPPAAPTSTQPPPLAQQRELAQKQPAQGIPPQPWHTAKPPIPPARHHLLPTSPKVSPFSENLPYQARGGQEVHFQCHMGQWCAQVLSLVGNFSRQALLPVVCSQGADVASSLEVLSRYPSWCSQYQIHVLSKSESPTLGEVVYIGALGLRGGCEGEGGGKGKGSCSRDPQEDNERCSKRPKILDSAPKHLLTVKFHQQCSPETSFVTHFVNQFTQLKVLLSSLNKPGALFVSKLSHNSPELLFILYSNNLFLWHPGGATQGPEPYEDTVLLAIKERNLVEELYVSLPLPEQEAQSLCPGPILPKLCMKRHCSQLNTEDLEAVMSQPDSLEEPQPESAPDQAPGARCYKKINASSLLLPLLRSLSQSDSSSSDSTEVVNLPGTSAPVQALPEQILFDKLVLGMPITSLHTNPYYRALLNNLVSLPEAANAQGETEPPASLGKRVASGEVTPPQVASRPRLDASSSTQGLASGQPLGENYDGCTLARQLLSEDPNEQEHVREFLSEHKYKRQHASTLALMAREVSSVRGVAGIQALLRHMESDKEIVGLQHLLLQLPVIHEWLSITHGAVEDDMATLEGEFKVLTALSQWFQKGLEHIRSQEYGTGHKLLELLTSSLQTFQAVFSRAPELFHPLKDVASKQYENVDARQAALQALGKMTLAVPSQASVIILTLKAAVKDPSATIRRAAIEAIAQVAQVASEQAPDIIPTLKTATQDQHATIRRAAIEAIAQVAQVASEQALDIIKILKAAVKDANATVRRAAIEALAQVAQVASEQALDIIKILKAAVKDANATVRRAAIEALGKATLAAPNQASAIIRAIEAAVKDQGTTVTRAAVETFAAGFEADSDEDLSSGSFAMMNEVVSSAQNQDKNFRSAAIATLAMVAEAAPGKARAIIKILKEVAANPDLDADIRRAAIEALGKVAQFVHKKACIIEILTEATTQDQDKDVRQAASEALAKVATAAPDEASAIIEILTEVAANPDLDADIRRAAIEALVKVAAAVPDVAPHIIEILTEAAEEHQDAAVRRAASEALQRAEQADHEQTPAITQQPEAAGQEQDEDIRQAAIETLQCYWDTQDPRHIPHITTLLYYIPLVVKSQGQEQQQMMILYVTAERPQTWEQHQEAVERFVYLVRAEAGQAEKNLEYYTRYLAMLRNLGLDNNHPDVASSLNNVGRAHQARGDHARALESYMQALTMYQALYSEHHPRSTPALIRVDEQAPEYHEPTPVMHQDLVEGNFLPTEQVLSNMEILSPDLVSPDQALPNEVARSLNNVGGAHYALGDYDEALQYGEQALTMRQNLDVSNHALIANSLSNVGLAHHALGKHQQALECHQQALTIRQSLYEPNHALIANSLANVGTAHHALGEYQQALECHQQALTIRQNLYEPNHALIANSLANVGTAHHALGEYQQALECHQQALTMRQNLYEPNHALIANSLDNVGLAHQGLGEHQQALEYHDQALEMRQRRYGANHAPIADSLDNVLLAYHTLGIVDFIKIVQWRVKIICRLTPDAVEEAAPSTTQPTTPRQ